MIQACPNVQSAAGYYPAILRVEHPAVRYKAVEGGTQEVEANPSELRFFDKHKGMCVGSCLGLHKNLMHVIAHTVLGWRP